MTCIPSFKVGNRKIGPDEPILVIGEVAQAHDGSLGQAHAMIDMAADSGCGAVKFQTHIAEAESTPDEPWRVKFTLQDETRFEYWKRMEFSATQWKGLADHADDRGLLFFSSVFSGEAIDLMESIGVPAWKFGAGEITSLPLIDKAAASGKPVFLSSGMSSWAELDQAVAAVQTHQCPVAVFQCTTAYPCPPDQVGLNVLGEMRARYGIPVGLSAHSTHEYAGLAAAALGADMIEVHITFSNACFGPDVPASLDPYELKRLCQGAESIRTMVQNPVDKDRMAEELGPLKDVFQKSIVVAESVPAGTVLEPRHLTFKKPGTGIPPGELDSVLGRTTREPLTVNQQLNEAHFD